MKDQSQDVKSVLTELSSAQKYWKSKAPKTTLGSPYNYDGPSAWQTIKSFQKVYRDVAVSAGINFPEQTLTLVDKLISKFVQAFFQDLFERKTGEEVEQFASICKERQKDLLKVSNFFISNNFREAFEHMYLVNGANHSYAIKLDKAKYISNEMKSVLVYMEEINLPLGSVTLSSRPRFYIYLYKILFQILDIIRSSNIRDRNAVDALLLLPSSYGQLYEKLNPTSDIMDVYAHKLLTVLRSPGVEPSEEFWKLFEAVKADIKKDHPPKYVQEFRKALDNFQWELFNPKQFYATLKASTYALRVTDNSKEKEFRFPSFISSLFEPDEAKAFGPVQALDKYLGYTSSYLSVVESRKVYGFDVVGNRAITRMIPNPSKYKPRAIHLCGQADQDRLANIHVNVGRFLDSLPSDAKKDHYKKGVTFLLKVTNPDYRIENKNSIFVSDFSNATDTLGQSFQNKCLELLAPKEVVDYWASISKMSKVFKFYDGTEEPYIQESGQPQGYLGSFDAFSLAHHILMLMLMKCSHLTRIKASDFYRILGDDSIISYPEEVCDSVYDNHSWLCREANLLKNDSKSAKSFFNLDTQEYPLEILDFAKISVCDGDFITPLPSGLTQNYGSSFEDSLAAILWYNDHGITFKDWLYKLLLEKFGNDPISLIHALSVFTSGQVDYISKFKDDKIFNLIDSCISGSALYSYGLAELKSTILGHFLSDSGKEIVCKSDDTFECLWEGFFNTPILFEWATKLPSSHKFWILMDEAEKLSKDIQDLYELGDPKLASCIGILIKENEMSENIEWVLSRIHEIEHPESEEEIWQNFSYFSYPLTFGDTKVIRNLEVRSLRMKERNRARFLRKSIKENKRLYSQLSKSDLTDSYLEILNTLASCTNES